MGIDEKDADAAANTFLRSFAVMYPSYTDPDGKIMASLHTYAGTPQSFFFSRNGTQLYDKAGPYATAAALERDIRDNFHNDR